MQCPNNADEEALQVNLYNSMVIGIHNYYKFATLISKDCDNIHNIIRFTLHNRIGNRLQKSGEIKKGYIKDMYGKSKQIRFIHGRVIAPIGYIKHKYPTGVNEITNKYTVTGRSIIHKSLTLDMNILHRLMRTKSINHSIEYMDNRISLYCAQLGKCAITGIQLDYEDVHCHHILPRKLGGDDKYNNLIIVHKSIHTVLHATNRDTITTYLNEFRDKTINLEKLNKIRKTMGLNPIQLSLESK